MAGGVNWIIDATDDPLLPDGVPSFEGGQFSNLRANLLQPNQSKVLGNCDVDKLGKLRTRRGTKVLETTTGSGSPDASPGNIIQGLTSYQTKDYNYIVAANNRKLWKWVGSSDYTGSWVQIARGGVADNEDIIICRQGQINKPLVAGVSPGGYTIGDTELTVDHVGYVGLTASGGGTAPSGIGSDIVAVGEKLYFQNNLRTNYFEYTIKEVNAGGPTITITLEEPGLVFDVGDNWIFTVARPAKVNNAAGYPPSALSIAIDGYTGVPNANENFVIKSENTTRKVGAGSTNVLLNFTPHLQDDWVAVDANVPIIFAQGNDALYFTDGINEIYGWNGNTTGDPNYYGGLMKIGSHSILDDLAGNFTASRTKPPKGVKSLLWFQNRLIASAITGEPDAIYFSDFYNASAWDQDYQKVRIGGGESDPITGLLAWTDLNMLCFKKNSCYLINLDPSQNPNPEDPTLLVSSFAVKQLHKLIGCPAPFTAVQVGGGSTTPGSDVFFLDGDKKVHSIRRVMAAETQQEVGVAMSLPVQDVLDTINIDHIDRAVAFYHNEHYIIGFPSQQGAAGGALPNAAMAYNLLTQSWTGVWSWAPTCFARRTDLGSYSKLILGDWRANVGRVLQWMDDQSLDEETDETYQEFGGDIVTTIVTRAFTGGDFYSYKTGLNVEFEFDESVSHAVTVQVILDMIPQTFPLRGLLAPPFDTISEPRLKLPFILPKTLPASPGLLRLSFDLQRYGTWRELQFQITSPAGKLAIRSIRLTYFMDTLRLQTVPPTGILDSAGAIIIAGKPGP